MTAQQRRDFAAVYADTRQGRIDDSSVEALFDDELLADERREGGEPGALPPRPTENPAGHKHRERRVGKRAAA